MRLTRGQIVFIVVVVLVNVILWIIPSDVVESVARNRHILLGRYSRRHMTWLLCLAPISAIAIHLHLSATVAIKKKRIFRLLAVLMVAVPGVIVADGFLRFTAKWNYTLGKFTYLRPPHLSVEGEFRDEPLAARSYNRLPPGYGTIPWTLTTDKRGYRNPADADQYEVVIVGDSFVEGSEISDEHTLPVRFAAKSGVSTYNLGMSGYAPHHCLAALKEVGLELQPRWVFYVLYEGNDFKNAKITAKRPSRWTRFFKRSPIVSALDELMIRTLGPIGCKRHLACLEVLSWLPLEIPKGPDAKSYRFPPSILVDHCVTRADFENSKYWHRTRHNLDRMRSLCADSGVRFAVAYIPTNAHVLLPLVKDRLPAGKVRQFVGLRAKRELPPADEFLKSLLDSLDAKENLTREWCEQNEVPFISLTGALREAVAAGRQAYFTYNDHWTPVGQDIAAEALLGFWQAAQSATRSQDPGDHNKAEAALLVRKRQCRVRTDHSRVLPDACARAGIHR